MLRELIESDAENDEIIEAMPDLPRFYISNYRRRAQKRAAVKVRVEPAQPITQLAKQFDALANLQKTMRESDKLLIDGLRAQVEAEQPLADDSTDDRIVEMFLEVMGKKLSEPQPAAGPQLGQQPALEFAQKPIPPAGAVKKTELSDDQILAIVDEQVPVWLLTMIQAGKFKKKQVFEFMVKKRGVEAALFERAWKLIR